MTTKICRQCNQAKLVNEYSTRRAICKACYATNAKAKYQSKVITKTNDELLIEKLTSLLTPILNDTTVNFSIGKYNITLNIESTENIDLLGKPAIPYKCKQIQKENNNEDTVPEITPDEALNKYLISR
jgi:hypothetical protein